MYLIFAMSIFRRTFPNIQVLSFFDYATSHMVNVPDTFQALNMNMDPVGKQTQSRNR